jgi:hypothetical protein
MPSSDTWVLRSVADNDQPPAPLAGGLAVAAALALAVEPAEKVLDVDHTDGLVERVAIDRQARVAGIEEILEQFRHGTAGVHRDDLGARHKHIVDAQTGELDEIEHHRLGISAEAVGAVFFCVPVEYAFEALAQRLVAAAKAEHALDPTDQAAALGARTFIGGICAGPVAGPARLIFVHQGRRNLSGILHTKTMLRAQRQTYGSAIPSFTRISFSRLSISSA